MKLFIIFTLFFSQNIHSKTAKISFVRGSVDYQLKSKKKKLSKNTKILQGGKITTAAKSMAIITFPDGAKAKVGPNSQFVVNEIQQGKKGKTALSLLRGSVFIKVIKKSDKPNIYLKAGSVSMGIRGTEFFTSYAHNKKEDREDLWMCVNEGKVEVTSQDKKSIIVKEGEGIFIVDKKKITKPKPYAWTKKLNWNMDETKGSVEHKLDISKAYYDLLDQEYD